MKQKLYIFSYLTEEGTKLSYIATLLCKVCLFIIKCFRHSPSEEYKLKNMADYNHVCKRLTINRNHAGISKQ